MFHSKNIRVIFCVVLLAGGVAALLPFVRMMHESRQAAAMKHPIPEDRLLAVSAATWRPDRPNKRERVVSIKEYTHLVVFEVQLEGEALEATVDRWIDQHGQEVDLLGIASSRSGTEMRTTLLIRRHESPVREKKSAK